MSAIRSARALSPSARAVFNSPNPQKKKNYLVPLTPARNTRTLSNLLSPTNCGSEVKLQDRRSPASVQAYSQLKLPSNASYQLRKDLSSLLTDAFGSSPCRGPKSDQCQSSLSSPLYSPNPKTDFLGSGTFGEVTLCKYKGYSFALKMIRRTPNVGEKLLVGVNHENLVKVLGITSITDRIFICMEYAGHNNLMNLLDNSISIRKRISFTHQIARGLQHCHEQGILHGDVKPANVIVSAAGLCKLGDFGLSVRIASRYDTNRFYLRGTAAYAAPEMLQNNIMSTASDIYSMGMTMWHIYSCEIPFYGMHPHVIIYKVVKQHERPPIKKISSCQSTGLYVSLIKGCWQHDAHRRPSSLHLVSTLEDIIYKSRGTP